MSETYYYATGSEITAIADSIRTKTGNNSSLQFPDDFVTAINNINGQVSGNVIFIDYDGSILYTYTAAQANNLSALPLNPSHTGLTSQGWNYTLAQIKSMLSTNYHNEMIVVGQSYITSSGATEIDISLNSAQKSPYLQIAVNGTVSVNWGDGNTGTITGSSITTNKWTQHTYSAGGNYTITLTGGAIRFIGAGDTYGSVLSSSGSATTAANNTYVNNVIAIRLGSNASLGNYAFNNCRGLQTITIPTTITNVGEQQFCYCYSLETAILPIGTTGNLSYTFYQCQSLRYVSLPTTITSIGTKTFFECYRLEYLFIPDGITLSLSSQDFNKMYNVKTIHLPSTITTLGEYSFSNNISLNNLYIPSSVTTINASAFSGCQSMKQIHFLSTTVPTLADSNAFGYIYRFFTIYVPSSKLSSYKSASNWSTYANNMQGE